jgi:hypothetical protein
MIAFGHRFIAARCAASATSNAGKMFGDVLPGVVPSHRSMRWANCERVFMASGKVVALKGGAVLAARSRCEKCIFSHVSVL